MNEGEVVDQDWPSHDEIIAEIIDKLPPEWKTSKDDVMKAHREAQIIVRRRTVHLGCLLYTTLAALVAW